MYNLSNEKRMTLKELSEVLKVSHDTIRNKIKEYFPSILQNGKTTYLNKWQVTKIKMELEKNPNLPTNEIVGMTDLEALVLQKKLDQWKDDKIKQLSQENQVMKPKAEYYNKLVDNTNLTNFRDTAKQIGLGQKEFIEKLLEDGYVYRDPKGKLKPYNHTYSHKKKYFHTKDFVNDSNYTNTQTLITTDGKECFSRLYGVNK